MSCSEWLSTNITKCTQSQNITPFATFPFWPYPPVTPPAHAPFNKSYQVCYGLIGNYPSFKMIPNTTYIVLILKKYNRSKSSFLTFCAGYIRLGVLNSTKSLSFVPTIWNHWKAESVHNPGIPPPYDPPTHRSKQKYHAMITSYHIY